MEIYILCFFAFLAGFIDSVVGGGGLVSVPAFFVLYPQLSISNIIGTNRLASAVGTMVAAWNYAKSVVIPWRTVFCAALTAALASWFGARFQSRMPAELFKPLLLALMVGIAFYTYSKKKLGQEEALRAGPEAVLWRAAGIGALLGFYNGFFGPGTGSLLVFGFVSAIGYSFLRASAISKIINFVADVASLWFFVSHGFILYELALPMMACQIAGAWLGSRMAVLWGNGFIRAVFLVVVAGIIARFAWDVFLVKSVAQLSENQ